jgi:hypothetical protein
MTVTHQNYVYEELEEDYIWGMVATIQLINICLLVSSQKRKN